MGVVSEIISGAGARIKALVKATNISDENALCVNISGASPQIYVPVGPAVSGDILDTTVKDSGGSESLNVNASLGSPQTFRLEADEDQDLILTELVFYGIDTAIKIEGFFNNQFPLTNGLILTVRSDGIESSFRTIVKTSDFELYSTLGGYSREDEAGGATLKAIRQFPPAFPIRRKGTNGPDTPNDFVQVTVQDNISSLTNLIGVTRGFRIKAGAL